MKQSMEHLNISTNTTPPDLQMYHKAYNFYSYHKKYQMSYLKYLLKYFDDRFIFRMMIITENSQDYGLWARSSAIDFCQLGH